MEKLARAIHYAAGQHVNQFRKNSSNDPYIVHPIEVMNILRECGVTDVNTLCGGVLHDTVEDTGTKADDLITLFGNDVCRIVMECTDDKSLSKVQRKQLQIEHASTISNEAKLVKLADKYSNIKGLSTDAPAKWSQEEIIGYVKWGFAVCQSLYGQNEKLDKLMQQVFAEYGVTSVTEEDLNAYYILCSK
jgi:guanosine-3',5'-bis(diphosphate) 3'-pyrophosphohydrolase